jgi:ribosomal protein L7Ae-like RNA K-turn-binding protein
VSERLASLLGLGARGRRLVIGVTGVRARLQQGKLACVVIAADASGRTRDKVQRLAAARGIPVLQGPTAIRLGVHLGRPAVQAVGTDDAALTKGLMALAEEGRGDTDS